MSIKKRVFFVLFFLCILWCRLNRHRKSDIFTIFHIKRKWGTHGEPRFLGGGGEAQREKIFLKNRFKNEKWAKSLQKSEKKKTDFFLTGTGVNHIGLTVNLFKS